jgi:hypothetical protein
MSESPSRVPRVRIEPCCLWPHDDVPRPGWLPEDLERAFRIYANLYPKNPGRRPS